MNTRDQIIKTGMDLWRSGGEAAVTARGIAAALGITHAGVLFHWKNKGGVAGLRAEIAQAAVALNDAGIIRRLIVDRHSAVTDMDQSIRQVWLSGA